MAISECTKCGREYDPAKLERCPRCGTSRGAAWDKTSVAPKPAAPSEAAKSDAALQYQHAEIERLNQVIGLLQQHSVALQEQNTWLRKIRGWLIFLWFGLVFVPGLLGLLILAAIGSSQ